jgi:hypothetical protein
LVPYTPPTSVIWLDSPPIEVAAPGLRMGQRPNWTARLVGTGMMAATVASGMLLADSINHQPPTEKPDDSVARTPSAQPKGAAGLPKAPIATPESLPLADLSGAGATNDLPLKPGTLQSRLPKLLKQQAKLADRLAATDQPGTARFSLNSNFKLGQPILRSVQDLPTVAVNQTAPAPEPLALPANVLSTLPPPPVTTASSLPANQPVASPTAGLQANPTPAAPDPTPAPVAPPASATAPLPTNSAIAETNWVTTKVAKGSDQPSAAAEPSSALSASPQMQPTPAVTPLAATPTAQPPQSIQDFVQSSPASTPWLPLTQQAANEALATNQVNQFRVFRINSKDYQRIWHSSQGLKELPPAHGFVDYGQRVIIVPQSSVDVTTQPSAPATPSAAPGTTQPTAPEVMPITRPATLMPVTTGSSRVMQSNTTN